MYHCCASMPAKNPRMALVIDQGVKDRIAFLAGKHRRSTSSEIVTAIEDWIQRHDEDMADYESASSSVTA